MAVSTKYGKIEIDRIGDDEPVFVIRARDALGISALEDYRAHAETQGRDSIVESVDKEIAAFEKFAAENETKLPT